MVIESLCKNIYIELKNLKGEWYTCNISTQQSVKLEIYIRTKCKLDLDGIPAHSFQGVCNFQESNVRDPHRQSGTFLKPAVTLHFFVTKGLGVINIPPIPAGVEWENLKRCQRTVRQIYYQQCSVGEKWWWWWVCWGGIRLIITTCLH